MEFLLTDPVSTVHTVDFGFLQCAKFTYFIRVARDCDMRLQYPDRIDVTNRLNKKVQNTDRLHRASTKKFFARIGPALCSLALTGTATN